MNHNAFTLKRVCFEYDESTQIFKHLDLSIQSGKIIGILGENGCGKSTLFKLLTKQEEIKSGTIEMNEQDITLYKNKEYSKMVSVVHQYNQAPRDITVKDLVSYGRTPYQKGLFPSLSQEDYNLIETAMEDTDLIDLKDKRVSELSGGQRQRVWLAMALAQNTNILLLDEMTTYLDIKHQLDILNLIKERHDDTKTTIVILHDINQAIEYCDELILLKKGQVVAQGKTNEIINESLLEEVFDIQTKIIDVEETKMCLFRRTREGV